MFIVLGGGNGYMPHERRKMIEAPTTITLDELLMSNPDMNYDREVAMRACSQYPPLPFLASQVYRNGPRPTLVDFLSTFTNENGRTVLARYAEIWRSENQIVVEPAEEQLATV